MTLSIEKARRKYANDNNKVILQFPEFSSLYLPSVASAGKRFGVDVKSEKWLSAIYREFGIEAPVSSSTMRNLTRTGVGVRSFVLLWNSLKNITGFIPDLFSISGARRIFKVVKLGSNGGMWWLSVEGFRAGIQNRTDAYDMLMEFIDLRAEADSTLR